MAQDSHRGYGRAQIERIGVLLNTKCFKDNLMQQKKNNSNTEEIKQTLLFMQQYIRECRKSIDFNGTNQSPFQGKSVHSVSIITMPWAVI